MVRLPLVTEVVIICTKRSHLYTVSVLQFYLYDILYVARDFATHAGHVCCNLKIEYGPPIRSLVFINLDEILWKN